jgi:glycosyltransferase involved in cell wall biosynthesis
MTSRQKIMVVSPAFKKIGGKATFARYFVTYLKSQPGYEVIHLENTRSSRKRKNTHPTLGYKAIRNNSLTRLAEMAYMVIVLKFRYLIMLLKDKPDMIFLFTSSYLDFLDNSVYINLAKLFRKKIILRIGGGGFDYFYQNSGSLMKRYIRRVIRKTDKLICQSEYWKDYFAGNDFREEASIHIIPNLIDCSVWPVHEYPTSGDSSVTLSLLFMPGYQADIKGYDDLMPVFRDLASTCDIRLTIVGLHHKIEEAYSTLLTTGRIVIIPVLDGELKNEVYRKSDIYVLPSYMEGFPNTLIEAMASGLPVVTTNIPAIKAIMKDRENAILVEPGNREQLKNALLELIVNHSMREEMGKINRSKCEQLYDISLLKGYLKNILQRNYEDELIKP